MIRLVRLILWIKGGSLQRLESLQGTLQYSLVVTSSKSCCEVWSLDRAQKDTVKHGVRVVTSGKSKASKKPAASKNSGPVEVVAQPEPECRTYRITDRRTIASKYQYFVLWAEGDIGEGTWEWAKRLLEDGQKNRLDAVDRWHDYMAEITARNATLPEGERKRVLSFSEWAKGSRTAKPLLGANPQNTCMFDAMWQILEEGFGWVMPFTDDEVKAYLEERGLGEKGGVTYREFAGLFEQISVRFSKKKRISVDLAKLSKNIFRGVGKGVECVWILFMGDATPSSDLRA